MGYTLREAAEELGVKRSTLKTWAWERGVKFAPDLNRDRYLARVIEYEGKEYTITELAKMHCIPRNALSHRLTNGWSLEVALKEPLRAGNFKPRSGIDKSTEGVDIGRLWLRGKL